MLGEPERCRPGLAEECQLCIFRTSLRGPLPRYGERDRSRGSGEYEVRLLRYSGSGDRLDLRGRDRDLETESLRERRLL